jgi:peptidase inhibitor family I36
VKDKLKKLLAAFAMLLAVAGVLVVTEEPAAAAGTCNTGWVCFWPDAGYNGGGVSYTDYYHGYGCINLNQASWHDVISSFANYSGYEIIMYRDLNCGGGSLWWYNGGAVSNMYYVGFNDSMDSFKIL